MDDLRYLSEAPYLGNFAGSSGSLAPGRLRDVLPRRGSGRPTAPTDTPIPAHPSQTVCVGMGL